MAVAGGIWLGREGINAIPRQARGSYVILISLEKEVVVPAGGLGEIRLAPGYYAYAGSAMNGLRARLERHLRSVKKRHWHIDYLLEKAVVIDAAVREGTKKLECSIAGALNDRFDGIQGFGCSDCRCLSHLFYARDEGRLRDGIRQALYIQG